MYDHILHDDKAAAQWYMRAAENGNSAAQYTLATMYFQGRGVAKNETVYVQWLTSAANQGNMKAQYQLGNDWAGGCCGAPFQDDAKAVFWYQKAASEGLPKAQRVMAERYASGRGVPQSDLDSINWLRAAADQGTPMAMIYLSGLYSDGAGVRQDYVEGYMWATLALVYGRQHASLEPDVDLLEGNPTFIEVDQQKTGKALEKLTRFRDELALKRTPAEITEGEKRAAEWQAKHPIHKWKNDE
jgi:hypothetical protein